MEILFKIEIRGKGQAAHIGKKYNSQITEALFGSLINIYSRVKRP